MVTLPEGEPEPLPMTHNDPRWVSNSVAGQGQMLLPRPTQRVVYAREPEEEYLTPSERRDRLLRDRQEAAEALYRDSLAATGGPEPSTRPVEPRRAPLTPEAAPDSTESILAGVRAKYPSNPQRYSRHGIGRREALARQYVRQGRFADFDEAMRSIDQNARRRKRRQETKDA